MKIILKLSIIAIFLISCSKEIIWNAGEELTLTITLGPFSTVEFNSIFNVLLVQDTCDFVKITCGRNLMDRVHVNQEEDNVEISEYSDMNWTRSYRRTIIELHFKQLQFITINDCVKMESKVPVKGSLISVWVTCDLSELDIRVVSDHFKLSVSEDNFGIYKVSGVTGSSYLEPEGTAHFMMENLETDSCQVLHHGIGDCYVNAKRVLEGKITNRGRLMYKYYPSLRVTIDNNQGTIIPLSD